MRQSVQWHENKLSYNKARGILECIQHCRENLSSGFPKWIRSGLPIIVLSVISFTHLQSGFFQATSHLVPWFSNDNDAFWEYSDGCNSNLVFGYIMPQEQLKGAKFSFQYEKKTLQGLGLTVSLQTADPKLELKIGASAGSIKSRQGPCSSDPGTPKHIKCGPNRPARPLSWAPQF